MFVKRLVLCCPLLMAGGFVPPLANTFNRNGGRNPLEHVYEKMEWGWSHRSSCGVNSVYMLLKLVGVAIDRDEFEAYARVSQKGSTLLSLCQFGRQHGVELVARKCSSLDELARLEVPFIAHGRFRFDTESSEGHYYVILQYGNGGISFLDGTSGELREGEADWPKDKLTGYVLELQYGSTIPYHLISILAVVAILAAIVLRVRRVASGTLALALSTCWILSSSGTRAQEPALQSSLDSPANRPVTSEWRRREMNAGNGLYLLLKYYDLQGSFSDFIKRDGLAGESAKSLLDLKRVAASAGVDVQVLELRTPQQLGSILPALATLRDDRAQASFLALVIDASDSGITWIEPGCCQLQITSSDEFVDKWTGFAMARSAPLISRGEWVGLGLGVAPIGLWLLTRVYRRRRATTSGVLS